MPSAPVIENFDVFKQAFLRCILRPVILVVDQLRFQCTKETLCYGIILKKGSVPFLSPFPIELNLR